MISIYRLLKNIRQNKIEKDGTQVSGFVTAKENRPPRQCGNCRHMSDGLCHHPVVNIDPQLTKQKTPDGVKVDHDDCCDFFQNK